MTDEHDTPRSSGTLDRLFEHALPRAVAAFEDRPQQQAMAREVARALETATHLIIEAPTGVGKSLAYLIPALLFAQQTKCTGIVSTHTRNLQEQLLQKDIPLAQRALGRPVNAVVLKGRRNYLCPARLESALASPGSLFERDAQRELAALAAWASRTSDGDMDRVDFPLRPEIREMVCSEAGLCGPSSCGARCHYRRAHERARRAELVIINHALFFALFAGTELQEERALDNAFLIFDEAHSLEAVAGAGERVSRTRLLRQLRQLYDPRSRTGVLARTKPGGRSAVSRALRTTMEFWESVRTQATAQSGAYRSGESLLVRLRHRLITPGTLTPMFAELQEMLQRMEERTADVLLQRELLFARGQLQESDRRLSELLDCANADAAYWVEWQARARSPIALCAAPIDPSRTIAERVFRQGIPVILTSASLAVGGDLSYYAGRIGGGAARALLLDSPFDHRRQMRLSLAPACPDPDDPGYADGIAAWILEAIRRSGGRALVLFTSAIAMHAAATALQEELASEGIRLLVQGAGAGRDLLLEEFRRDIRSVLFGLDSFWYGVDVPGEALEHVIIVRLPFPVPTHPAIEARLEAIESRGGNPFRDYMLPEAVLKLRQGTGRLIRSASDRGVVTILDSRILKKSYGRAFLDSLPRCRLELWTPGSDPEEVDTEEW